MLETRVRLLAWDNVAFREQFIDSVMMHWPLSKAGADTAGPLDPGLQPLARRSGVAKWKNNGRKVSLDKLATGPGGNLWHHQAHHHSRGT